MAFVWLRAVGCAGPPEAPFPSIAPGDTLAQRSFPLAVHVCIGAEAVYLGALLIPRHAVPSAPLLLAPGSLLRADQPKRVTLAWRWAVLFN